MPTSVLPCLPWPVQKTNAPPAVARCWHPVGLPSRATDIWTWPAVPITVNSSFVYGCLINRTAQFASADLPTKLPPKQQRPMPAGQKRPIPKSVEAAPVAVAAAVDLPKPHNKTSPNDDRAGFYYIPIFSENTPSSRKYCSLPSKKAAPCPAPGTSTICLTVGQASNICRLM